MLYCSKHKPIVRSLVWSKVLYSKQTKNVEKNIENKVNVDNLPASGQTGAKTTQEEQKPVVKIVVPNVKEEEVKASDVKIVLENIKEQDLSKDASAAEAIKQIKEKIFDTKPKDAEAEKGL